MQFGRGGNIHATSQSTSSNVQASVQISLKLYDSSNNLLKQWSDNQTIHISNQILSQSGGAGIGGSYRIPAGANADHIEAYYSISTTVMGNGSASASINRPSVTVQFLSVKGMRMTDRTGKRFSLKREGGIVAGHELVVEGDNGHEAHFVMNGTTLEIRNTNGGCAWKLYGLLIASNFFSGLLNAF